MLEKIVSQVNGIVWNPALVVLLIAAGLYFSFRTHILFLFHSFFHLNIRLQKLKYHLYYILFHFHFFLHLNIHLHKLVDHYIYYIL